MDNPERATGAGSNVNDLRAECESLRHSVMSVLILVLVVSGTLNVFFWRQFKATKVLLDAERPQINQMVADYSKGQGVAITNFLVKLAEFEKKNPDFSPILAKYGVPLGFTAAPPAAASTPASSKK